MACEGNQYGGFDQTLFLGCSIVSFSASVGWGEQSTELTVELVQDEIPSPAGYYKTYYNLSLTKQQWIAADPGFIGEQIEIIGMPAYFRIKDFEFCGIIQSWEYSKATSGRKYVVKLISPTQILENAKAILGEYAGGLVPPSPYILPSAYSPSNIINIFGYAEGNGISCPLTYQSSPGVYSPGDGGIDGAVFGTQAGAFGGSKLNNNGMPWYMIRNIMNLLLNAFPIISGAADFSPHGRLTGKGNNIGGAGLPWSNGFGLLNYDSIINTQYMSQYFLDISEVPKFPLIPDYFRFNQSEVSILEMITTVCQEAGHDFYIELIPCKLDGGIAKIIKIRTVSRIASPVFGAIDAYIQEAENKKILMSSSSGKEFRNEINSRFVIGGLKQTLYQAYQSYDPEGDGNPSNPEADNMILPFFGTDSSGNMLVPWINNSGLWTFETPTDNIEASLEYITFGGFPITITEDELRSTTAIHTWQTYINAAKTDTYWAMQDLRDSLALPDYVNLYSDEIAFQFSKIKWKWQEDLLRKIYHGRASDFNKVNDRLISVTNPIYYGQKADVEKIYNWIQNFASEYYGKKFAVRVPYSCIYIDPESNQILSSEQPTQDGGWTEMTGVLGLGLNSPELTFFRNDTNKIETIVAYTGFDLLDTSVLPEDSYAVYNNNLYIKGTVDSEYVYHNASTFSIPRAIVEIPDLISSGQPLGRLQVEGLLEIASMVGLTGIPEDDIADAYKSIGNKGLAVTVIPYFFTPDAVAFGIKSNINTYGPWVHLGPVGGIAVEKNDSLVPWEYGGYTNLNLAGNAFAGSAVTNMQVSEMGSITVAGYPEVPLGAELRSLSSLVGTNLVENRTGVLSSYNGHDYVYFNYPISQSGVYGPSVTSVSVNFGQEVTTQYQFRTYTPQFGRFARLNAERLKEVNQNRMKYVRDLRTYVRENAANKLDSSIDSKSNIQSKIKSLTPNFYGKLESFDRIFKPGTPHELFVGQLLPWGEGKRTVISTSSFNEIFTEVHPDVYDSKSISTLETIIRPISIKGAGGLPKLIKPIMSETGNFSGVGSMTISQADLNPYINPLSIDSNGLINRRYNYVQFGGNLGHDFDLVSRCDFVNNNPLSGIMSGIPSGGLSLYGLSGGIPDYKQDYRTFALRGPILLHSWGYDTDGNAIPNYYDNINQIVDSGIYTTTGVNGGPLTGTFMSGFATRPDSWPVAPVDLRLNRQRGVWEAGGLCTIIRGRATSSSSIDTLPFNGDTIQFMQGSDNSVAGDMSILSIENTFGWSVSPGQKFMAIKAVGSSKYYALQVEC